MKEKNLIAITVGLLFVASALVPLGIFHFVGEANIMGTLWNFMLPTGWFSIIIGTVLLFQNKIGMKSGQLRYMMLIAGVVSIVLFFLQDADYFLGLWTGVKGDFDVDGKWFLTFISLYVGLISIFASLLLGAKSYRTYLSITRA